MIDFIDDDIKNKKNNKQIRNWVFTLNCKFSEDINLIKNLFGNYRYLVFKKELGHKENYYHWQGYVEYNSGVRFSTITNAFDKNIHIEERRGTQAQAIDYVKKDDTAASKVYEFGEPKLQGVRNDIEDFVNEIKNGKSDIELLNLYPKLYLQYSNKIIEIRKLSYLEFQKKTRNVKVYYLFGNSGSGKTSSIYRDNDISKIYKINYQVFNWDNYSNQDVLLIDEFNSQIDYYYLLQLLDIYPLILNARYNNRFACWTKVYITSNIPLEEQYNNFENLTYSQKLALFRRIDTISNLIFENDRYYRCDKKVLYINNEIIYDKGKPYEIDLSGGTF